MNNMANELHVCVSTGLLGCWQARPMGAPNSIPALHHAPAHAPPLSTGSLWAELTCCCVVACALQGVHNQWQEPDVFRPERFMPGGEYDQFEENVRPYMFVPFIQVGPPHRTLGTLVFILWTL